jgi:uncharacterized protein (TIGR04255 family)
MICIYAVERRDEAMKTVTATSAGRRIKFENPPVNELIIALYHLPMTELKAQHIGSYWDRIRKKYPLCDQQPIVTLPEPQPPGLLEAPGELFPLPRFWFYNTSHPTLIQVQRNAFMLNWRRSTAGLPDSEYPHYEAVAKDFWEELENYKAFVQEAVGGKLDPIQRCELTYVNLIVPNELFASPAQLVNVLPSAASLYDLQTEERHLVAMNSTVVYRVSPILLVDLAIRLGRRSDTNEPALGLELKAHGVPTDLSLESARAWYDAAHDATYKLFLEATAQAVQEKIWKPL